MKYMLILLLCMPVPLYSGSPKPATLLADRDAHATPYARPTTAPLTGDCNCFLSQCLLALCWKCARCWACDCIPSKQPVRVSSGSSPALLAGSPEQ